MAKQTRKKTSATSKKKTGAKRSSKKRVTKKSSAAAKKKTTSAKKASKKAPAAKQSKKASPAGKTVKAKTAKKKTAGASRKAKATSSSPEATALDPIQFPELAKPMPKTHLTAKQLREYKKLLLRKRAELAGDVLQLTDVVTNRKGNGGDHSSMPIHMADLGSDNWEQEFTLGLIANERDRIRDIDDALLRIENKTYGVCVATHKPISEARLHAKPWARYCIDYARAREEGRLR